MNTIYLVMVMDHNKNTRCSSAWRDPNEAEICATATHRELGGAGRAWVQKVTYQWKSPVPFPGSRSRS